MRIENAKGHKFDLPESEFSKTDREYLKKVLKRTLFKFPEPFEDEGNGAVIIAGAKGEVEVQFPKRDYYANFTPKPRPVTLGESIDHGATLITGKDSQADLLLTNGTLIQMAEKTRLILSALYQKNFQGSKDKASDLKKEVSPSRSSLKLEEGNLVVDVRKLNKESSFLIETNVAHAGIRGTQFKISANADSADLAVLEGSVDFMDGEKKITSVQNAMKAGAKLKGSTKLKSLPENEKREIKKRVSETKKLVSSINLNRLSNAIYGYSQKRSYTLRSIGMEMIWCPPGTSFIGGDPEYPTLHKIILTKGFYLSKYEVSQEQYEKVMGENPSVFKDKNNPVDNVSWAESMKFCEKLMRKERVSRGRLITLPTEAEWEYACRAGTTTAYSWGDNPSPKFANYPASRLAKTVSVKSYKPNPWGFHNMHGNVWEWCKDSLGPFPSGVLFDYESNSKWRPEGETSGVWRILRGGSWSSDESWMRSSRRHAVESNYKQSDYGFRVAFKKID